MVRTIRDDNNDILYVSVYDTNGFKIMFYYKKLNKFELGLL